MLEREMKAFFTTEKFIDPFFIIARRNDVVFNFIDYLDHEEVALSIEDDADDKN